jgi:hypothetical protein
MVLFHTDFLSLARSNLQAEKAWWIAAFEAVEAKVPADWDCHLPADVALPLPDADRPTILLSDKTDVKQAGYDRQNDHPLVFCSNLKKAHAYLSGKNAKTGPMQDGGGTQYFEVRDAEDNAIEICREP